MWKTSQIPRPVKIIYAADESREPCSKGPGKLETPGGDEKQHLQEVNQKIEVNLSNLHNAPTSLQFIPLYICPINSTTDKQIIIEPTLALYDSGATNTLISEKFYKTINSQQQFPVKNSNFILNLADDGKMKVKGEVTSQIEIRDGFHNSTIFIHNLLVISNLRHEILIGQDILTSRVYATTQEAIIFNKIPGKIYNTSRIKYNPNYIIVPFVKNLQSGHKHRGITNIEIAHEDNAHEAGRSQQACTFSLPSSPSTTVGNLDNSIQSNTLDVDESQQAYTFSRPSSLNTTVRNLDNSIQSNTLDDDESQQV